MTEPVRVQIKMRVLTREGHDTLKRSGRTEILKTWAMTGATPNGIEISAVTWQNYDRKTPGEERTANESESIERARETLRLDELFQEQTPVGRKVRSDKGIRKPKHATNRRRQKKRTGKKQKPRKRSAKARTGKRRKSSAHITAKRRMGKNRKK